MDGLLSYFKETCSLPSEATQAFLEIITIQSIAKGTSFINKGAVNKKEYILLEGICRSYVLDPNGKEITLSFFTANTAISPNLTRTKSNLSILHIQAITAIKIATFPSQELLALMQSNRAIEAWANAVLQKELLKKVEKEINQNAMSAKERLMAFRAKYPLLENLIPHTYIASFLGITNVSLSRLRKGMLKK